MTYRINNYLPCRDLNPGPPSTKQILSIKRYNLPLQWAALHLSFFRRRKGRVNFPELLARKIETGEGESPKSRRGISSQALAWWPKLAGLRGRPRTPRRRTWPWWRDLWRLWVRTLRTKCRTEKKIKVTIIVNMSLIMPLFMYHC